MCRVPGSHLFSWSIRGWEKHLIRSRNEKCLHTKIINCDDKWKFIDARISEKLLNFTLY